MRTFETNAICPKCKTSCLFTSDHEDYMFKSNCHTYSEYTEYFLCDPTIELKNDMDIADKLCIYIPLLKGTDIKSFEDNLNEIAEAYDCEFLYTERDGSSLLICYMDYAYRRDFYECMKQLNVLLDKMEKQEKPVPYFVNPNMCVDFYHTSQFKDTDDHTLLTGDFFVDDILSYLNEFNIEANIINVSKITRSSLPALTDFAHKYADSNHSIVLATAYADKDDYPDDEYYYEDEGHGDKELPLDEIVRDNTEFFNKVMGFIDINFLTGYEYKNAMILGNNIGTALAINIGKYLNHYSDVEQYMLCSTSETDNQYSFLKWDERVIAFDTVEEADEFAKSLSEDNIRDCVVERMPYFFDEEFIVNYNDIKDTDEFKEDPGFNK